MYARGEHRECPQCGVALERFEDLPPSPEAQAEQAAIAPELVTLPFADFRRGRGALAIIAVLGLTLFFLPWFEVRSPETFDLSGLTIAARRLFWVWAAPVAWFVMIPTVLTRRTIYRMRGARVAVAFLAAFPGVTAINLLIHPPRGIRVTSTLALRVDAHPSYALVGTLVLSVLALGFAFFFGGLAKRRAKGDPVTVPPAPTSSAGHTLH